MKIIAILFLIFIFFKSIYYGIYELKKIQNKTAAIAMFFMATVRSNIPYSCITFSLLDFANFFINICAKTEIIIATIPNYYINNT